MICRNTGQAGRTSYESIKIKINQVYKLTQDRLDFTVPRTSE